MNGCPCFTRSCLCPFISLETNISISVLAYGWGYPDRALDDGVWDELISNGVGAQLMRCNMPAPSRRLGSIRIWCMVVTRQGAMTFAIHASKNGQSVVTVRISQMLLPIKLAYWKASVGKFILQIRPVASSTCQALIGFSPGDHRTTTSVDWKNSTELTGKS